MKHLKTLIAACLLCTAPCGPLSAQEGGFDLSSQRSESQVVPPVPGHKTDHRGVVVNPTPHRMELDASQRLDLSKGLKVRDRQGRFAEDLGFLPLDAKGAPLDIDFGAKAASRRGSGSWEKFLREHPDREVK